MSAPSTKDTTKLQSGRPPKPKQEPSNPIETAVKSWISTLPEDLVSSIFANLNALLAALPKRWTVYTPMVLLPSGSFGSCWEAITASTTAVQTNTLWITILREVSSREGKGNLTHLAINSGIPLSQSDNKGADNILRTPSGLVMLYGDFGPALPPDALPSPEDFTQAFWVSTKQNGIFQIWAPRYTMFSRGNIKEKARLLEFHKSKTLASRNISTEELKKSVAVDLYAGIGYFVFSYVAMDMGRVLGWELNPWSVEGLRRGALANRWTVKIVKPGNDIVVGDERIVIFQEDNNLLEKRLFEFPVVKWLMRNTLHVNCGLLPTSLPVWRTALRLLDGKGWLHLHENVGVHEISARPLQIENMFREWAHDGNDRRIKVEHAELVKTFAPGVWHCVFDVWLGDAVVKG